MRTDAGGARFYTAEDVNRERVRAAMREVGDRATAEQIALMRAEGKGPCNALDERTKLTCNSWPLGYFLKGWRCERHTPSAEMGRAEPAPRCNKPLRCYCAACSQLPNAHEENDRAREQLSQRELAWVHAVKTDVLQLARGRVPFTLRELAEHLPPARSAERALVEQSLLALLAEGVDRGLIVKHPERNEWKGAQHG